MSQMMDMLKMINIYIIFEILFMEPTSKNFIFQIEMIIVKIKVKYFIQEMKFLMQMQIHSMFYMEDLRKIKKVYIIKEKKLKVQMLIHFKFYISNKINYFLSKTLKDKFKN